MNLFTISVFNTSSTFSFATAPEDEMVTKWLGFQLWQNNVEDLAVILIVRVRVNLWSRTPRRSGSLFRLRTRMSHLSGWQYRLLMQPSSSILDPHDYTSVLSQSNSYTFGALSLRYSNNLLAEVICRIFPTQGLVLAHYWYIFRFEDASRRIVFLELANDEPLVSLSYIWSRWVHTMISVSQVSWMTRFLYWQANSFQPKADDVAGGTYI